MYPLPYHQDWRDQRWYYFSHWSRVSLSSWPVYQQSIISTTQNGVSSVGDSAIYNKYFGEYGGRKATLKQINKQVSDLQYILCYFARVMLFPHLLVAISFLFSELYSDIWTKWIYRKKGFVWYNVFLSHVMTSSIIIRFISLLISCFSWLNHSCQMNTFDVEDIALAYASALVNEAIPSLQMLLIW